MPPTENEAPAVGPLPADGGRRGFLRGFARLAGPFFTSEERWHVWLLTAGVIALTLLQIGIQVRLNLWNRDFFNALENHDWKAFLGQMGMFGVLAGASMGTAVYQVYLKQLLQLRWRRWLTTRLMHAWLEGGRHYQLNFIGNGIENPDQRIAENVRGATEMAVEFALGIFNAALTLVSFIGILWALSGTLPVTLSGISFEIPGYMVWAALIYAAIGSALTYLVGRPIIAANIRQNAAEADFRFALVRLRENSEGVALIGGEPDEEKGLHRFLAQVVSAATYLMRTQRQLMWMTSAYAMVGMVYPTLVASPRFFAGAITLGGLMQITAAFGQVQTGLTWFVDNFPRIAEWRSHVERVLEFERTVSATIEAKSTEEEVTSITLVQPTEAEGKDALVFEDLQIANSDGTIMIADANTEISKGEKVLISGESGSGKSTLFRAIAGLWPWGSGTIRLPKGKMMFMPQRPYLPLGSLRAALTYPAAPEDFPEDVLRSALERCALGQFADRLDQVERWDRLLSAGEQQRVAFARLLLHRPDWVFMDEATAALDEERQTMLMTLFRDELPDTTLISIAHRAGLDAFHERTLHLVKSPTGTRLEVQGRRPSGKRGSRRKGNLGQKLIRSLAGRTP